MITRRLGTMELIERSLKCIIIKNKTYVLILIKRSVCTLFCTLFTHTFAKRVNARHLDVHKFLVVGRAIFIIVVHVVTQIVLFEKILCAFLH